MAKRALDNEFFLRAGGFRMVASDLQRAMNTLASAGTVAQENAERVLAYTTSITVLRALSAESMLKAIACARSDYYLREHDLLLLYAALDDQIKPHIETVADSIGVASPEKILERHRTEFVDWRYPAEGDQSTSFLDLDKVLQVLHDVYRQIKAGNAPQPLAPSRQRH